MTIEFKKSSSREGNIGFNIESNYGDDLFPKARVKNDPVKVTTESFELPPIDPVLAEKVRQRKAKILSTRIKNFTEGVDLFKRFEKVNIMELNYCAENWNYFDKPTREELLNLIGSIENIGLISPLVLLREANDSLTIISGKSRVIAMRNLYANTKNERYLEAPAFILDYSEVDEYFLRNLIIDSNIQYRKISKNTLIMAAIERFEILKSTKMYRSDTQIVEALSKEFLIGRSTLFTYISLRKLREEVMVLLLENRIKLEPAKCLARVNQDMQLMILENFGIEYINELHRIKYLTKEDNLTLPRLLRRINTAMELVPWKTRITIVVNKYLIEPCLKYVGDFKKYAIMNFEEKFNTKNSDEYCKVAVNYEEMKYYLEKEIINKSLLDLVFAKNREELLRL